MLTQQQYLLLQRPTRYLHIKVELLNQNDVVIDVLQGYAISGNININADSAYRRSGNLKMVIHNNNLIPSPSSKIWFNRKVRIYIGLMDWNDEIVWFNQGQFVIQNAQIDLSGAEKIIELDLADCISLIDGTLGGNLSHETRIIAQSTTINQALRSVLSSLGKVSIDEIKVDGLDALVPYDITSDPNSTVYDLVKELLNLYMGWEIFYNESGYLIIQKIKDRKNDPVVWDFTQNSMNLTINYTTKTDFANVRNSFFIWGRKLDTGETVKWIYKNKYVRNTTTERDAITDKQTGDICHVLNENKSYVWDGSWQELSFTVVPDFSIERIGEKVHVYSDDKIFNVSQAKLRAEYELKQRSNLAETISLNCVPIYGLQANNKIRISVPEINVNGDYLIKSISFDLSIGGAMQIEAVKLYY